MSFSGNIDSILSMNKQLVQNKERNAGGRIKNEKNCRNSSSFGNCFRINCTCFEGFAPEPYTKTLDNSYWNRQGH